MNAFDISAVLTLNSAQYDAGLARAKGGATGLGGSLSKIGTIAKVGFAAAGAAAVAFGVKSIKTGMDFDKSMSQVAATLGKTVEELNTQTVSADTSMGHFNGTLRDFAKKMGSETQFTAKESADALNYMALAGYDAKTSVTMLPNVLNLAAAGNMELASASDMVTDAQSALGLSLDETTEMVDKMAKTSSKSNTNVEQLGSAFLTVGGTAKSLKGGTTELAQVLGLLADNGIKGAEGGTKLRNMILSLSAPTDKAAQLMEKLGVKTLDSKGNFRSMQDIMLDLGKALDGMGKGDRNKILSKIFNKQDLKAVNALLGTSKDRWSELSSAIDDSKGAAEKMAKTQLDNLEGDVKKLKSAFEGVQVAVAEKLTPALRNLVKGGTRIFSGITEALKSDQPKSKLELMEVKVGVDIPDFGERIHARIEALKDEIPKWLNESLPKIEDVIKNLGDSGGKLIDLGVTFVKSVGAGIAEGLPTLVEHLPTMIENIVEVIAENAPKLITAGVNLIFNLILGLIKSIPNLIKAIPKIIVSLVKGIGDLVSGLVTAGKDLIMGLVKGIKSAPGALVKAAKGLISKAFTAMKNSIKNIAIIGSTIALKIAGAIVKGVSKVKNAAVNLAKKAFNALKNGFKNVVHIGGDIVRGIWKGISNGYKWIRDKIRGWVGNVKGFFKKLFGIKSPSTWARDVIGANIVKGIAVGIEGSSDLVQDAVDDIMPDTDMSISRSFVDGGGLMGKMLADSKNVSIIVNNDINGAEDPEDFARRFARGLQMEMRMA